MLLLIPFLLPGISHAQDSARPRTWIVVLDPGHGGDDIGAADPSGTLVEKQLALQVAQRTAEILRGWKIAVYLTRTRDQAVNLPARDLNHDGHVNRVDEFDARNLFANKHHADLFVSIHFDASADASVRGTHGYYCPARPFWQRSLGLARSLTAHIAASLRHSAYVSANNGVQTDVADVVPQTRSDYPWFLVLGPTLRHFVTGTQMPGALIESLYLSNPADDSFLRKSGAVSAIARGYADGIHLYLGSLVRR